MEPRQLELGKPDLQGAMSWEQASLETKRCVNRTFFCAAAEPTIGLLHRSCTCSALLTRTMSSPYHSAVIEAVTVF